MSEFIKSLSFKAEFITIIVLCFGYSIISSLVIFLNNLVSTQSIILHFTNETFIGSILFEILILFLVVNFLKLRGNPIDFRNNLILFKLIGVTLFLIIVYYLTYFLLLSAVVEILSKENEALYTQINISKHLSPIVVIMFSIVNPIFEESIVVGYIITTVSKRKGIFFAINVSVLIRFLCHLYQGPIAALSIIPMGLIFGFVYWKWKNIWPLILAHGIMDLIALYMYGS